jgi:hypothetical protein
MNLSGCSIDLAAELGRYQEGALRANPLESRGWYLKRVVQHVQEHTQQKLLVDSIDKGCGVQAVP